MGVHLGGLFGGWDGGLELKSHRSFWIEADVKDAYLAETPAQPRVLKQFEGGGFSSREMTLLLQVPSYPLLPVSCTLSGASVAELLFQDDLNLEEKGPWDGWS